jgi:hypothetical protein
LPILLWAYNKQSGAKLKISIKCGIIKAMGHRNKLFLTLALFLMPIFTIFGADISVSSLDVIAHGTIENGELSIDSRANMGISLNGGYKFNVFLGWALDVDNLGKALAYRNFVLNPLPSTATVTIGDYNALLDRFNNQAVLSLSLIKATARDAFGIPLDISFFMGEADVFGNGDIFFSRWGRTVASTDFTSYYFFPEGIGGNPNRHYNGITVQGTGVSVAYTGFDSLLPMVYAYSEFAPLNQTIHTRFSGDARLLLNIGGISADIFGGISFGKDEDFEFRGGALMFFTAGNNEFFIQAGIPSFKTSDKFGMDIFYALAEQRLFYGIFSEHFTVFYHPPVYQRQSPPPTGEDRLDLNLKLAVGERTDFPFMGGADLTFGIENFDFTNFHLKVSPFVSMRTSGFELTFRARYDLLESDWEDALEMFIGMKASF